MPTYDGIEDWEDRYCKVKGYPEDCGVPFQEPMNHKFNISKHIKPLSKKEIKEFWGNRTSVWDSVAYEGMPKM